MIDRTHTLPERPVSDTALVLMRRLDELLLQYPFAGARMSQDLLRQEGHAIWRRQVVTLMRRMGIMAIYRKPRISQRHPAHRIYPYLLRQLTITRPNHVWCRISVRHAGADLCICERSWTGRVAGY